MEDLECWCGTHLVDRGDCKIVKMCEVRHGMMWSWKYGTMWVDTGVD